MEGKNYDCDAQRRKRKTVHSRGGVKEEKKHLEKKEGENILQIRAVKGKNNCDGEGGGETREKLCQGRRGVWPRGGGGGKMGSQNVKKSQTYNEAA